MLIDKQYKQFVSSPKYANYKFDDISSSFNSANISRTTTPNSKDYIKTQQIQLFFSYFRNFTLYKQLKQKYSYLPIFTDHQKRCLMSQTKICRKDFQQKASHMLNSSIQQGNIQKGQNLTILVIFGSLYWKRRKYMKNQSILIERGQPIFSLIDEEAICIYLCQKRLQAKIKQINYLHKKKDTITTYLKKGLGQLKKKQLEILASKSQLVTWTGNSQLIKAVNSQIQKGIPVSDKKNDQEQLGKYFLCLTQGVFEVLDSENKVLTEIQFEYFGQQILWKNNYEFGLRNKSSKYGYLIIPTQAVKQCFLNEEQYQNKIKNVKKIYQIKKQKRTQFQKFQTVYEQQMSKGSSKQKIKERINKPQKYEQFEEMLEDMKKMKPKWKIQEDREKLRIKNMRSNKFESPQQYTSPCHRHFSKIQAKQDEQLNIKFGKTYYQNSQCRNNIKLIKNKSVDLINMKVCKSYSKFGSMIKCQTKTRDQMSKTMYCQQMSSKSQSKLQKKRILSLSKQAKQSHKEDAFNTTAIKIHSYTNCQSQRNYNTEPNLQFQDKDQFQQNTNIYKNDHPNSNKILPFKSFQKTQKKIDNVHKWNPVYSQYYDRSLSSSLSKMKKMKRYQSINVNAHPKKYPFIFSLQDAMESKKLTFYQIKRKQKTQLFEIADKRKLQKIFKTKLLTSKSTTCPQTFR